jgi:hypothetical protein
MVSAVNPSTPDLGSWMIKRWLYLFGLGICFAIMLVNQEIIMRLAAGIGLLVFMQLREISYLQEIDISVAHAIKEGEAKEQNEMKKPANIEGNYMPNDDFQEELDARKSFVLWAMNAGGYKPKEE